MLCIKICDFISQGKSGGACNECFHNWLSAKLFKAAAGMQFGKPTAEFKPHHPREAGDFGAGNDDG